MIIHIAASDDALMIANAIRNGQVAQRKGALLCREGEKSEPRFLIEKIIDGVPLFADDDLVKKPVAASKVKWKKDAVVILVGKSIALLDEFEKLVPGFTKHHGPISKLALATSKA